MAARRSDQRAGERKRLREDTKPAAATYVRMINVANDPATDVTEEDCEKLLTWIDRKWGARPRDEFEANRWWAHLWSFRRAALAFACVELKNGPRPTLAQIREQCFLYRSAE